MEGRYEKLQGQEPIIYLIKWDNNAADTYLYGTSLTFQGDGTVQYANAMMPSGMVIRKWYSQTNYQGNRLEPQLPLMEAGDQMEVRIRMQTDPADTAFLRVNFYDDHGGLVSFTILRGEAGNFSFPEGAYSYSIELVEAGAKRILFYRIEMIPDGDDPFAACRLFEGEGDENSSIEQYIYNPSPRSSTVNILLPVQQRRMIRAADPDRLWNISNLVLAPPELAAPGVFFSDQFLRGKVWSRELSRFRKRNFIACGRGSGSAAYALEYRIPGSNTIIVRNERDLQELEL